ncbi:CobB/CobQ-like glutamine amidotransferase domain-containing protein [Tribonema minus]|uniref:phosphoribosylformylglycinamidine synthase n=1 Tax=Tribonema minus TaxID=303371 RepID=A0A835ZAY9_9STRA|nr:CobB/CobQ-like glutamine amidotransferase domain-containing protein [Tribonema minus]
MVAPPTPSQTKQVLHFYRTPGVLPHKAHAVLAAAQAALPAAGITSLDTEHCFNVEVTEPLSAAQTATLTWLLSETFEADKTAPTSFLAPSDGSDATASSSSIVEVGPRLSFESALSSNARAICRASGLACVSRVEVSRRWRVATSGGKGGALPPDARARFVALISDRMTETEYAAPLASFAAHGAPDAVETVRVLEDGRAALEDINARRGLVFDDWDMEYYLELFKTKLGRNPTDVELFDMGNANSEHSRHWFFGGKMVIDGVEKPKTLFQLVKDTIPKDKPSNSIIAFHDNSSAIRGCVAPTLAPETPGGPSRMVPRNPLHHPILTAETHNFPTGVAPFNGAETGTGGRLRDVMATGRGAHAIAGISSYSVGNLNIPGYPLPWEEAAKAGPEGWEYASNLATPLDIAIQASNGASDYGNKFGEPVVHGFVRSFGQRLPGGERAEYVKPIMFSAGIGQMNDMHTAKGAPEVGMWVVKVGGPAYRIGLGGGAASSRVGDAGTAALDFDAVQRGDAEMENRLNRLMRACVELGEGNPIISLHDQGAGGNGNVLKEIVEPMGAKYDIRNIIVGDETLSVLEIWGSEYQENNALLIRPESTEMFLAMARRENCPCALLGQVTGDGRVTVFDSRDGTTPYDLPLSEVLGDLPQKTFTDARDATPSSLAPLSLPSDATPQAALDRVLRLLQVGSKRFLTNKVDRSVTGLVAQQQCVGPLQTPLANCAVIAQGHAGTTGIATACGEQPIKGLVSPAAMARMTVAEALTNIMWAKVSALGDIKASGNWMWASKLPGECARMYDACEALRGALLACGVGIDGGKDSLSMAARCGTELVKSPGTLVMTLYVCSPDITLTVTPDLKPAPGGSALLYVDLGAGRARLGGTALAQVYNQVGNESPDVEDFAPLVAAFNVTQDLIAKKLISAGHDRSDGGLATCLIEMAIAGNVGLTVDVPAAEGGSASALDTLFSEEAGFVMQVEAAAEAEVVAAYAAAGVAVTRIGAVADGRDISISVGGEEVIRGDCGGLRAIWEATSFQLERRQCNPDCVAQEEASLRTRAGPAYALTFTPAPTPPALLADGAARPRVCVLRQEGSNGDREMLAAFHHAGFEAWDVNMMDLLEGGFKLDERFQGVVFVGGFSYADVLDSAKGWAATIKFNPAVFAQFQAFRARKDTFSLGVCNGCQLMALLGWVPGETADGDAIKEDHQPRFVHNDSGRFESRWSTVKIEPSPALMFKGMEGTSMGIWVAHGEGKALFPDSSILKRVTEKNLAPLRYVNDDNEATEAYPDNPNGSPLGITALCSEDGRHLAMMPHPERCFTTWQWPYMPADWKRELTVGPWLQMFQNARAWCVTHRA